VAAVVRFRPLCVVLPPYCPLCFVRPLGPQNRPQGGESATLRTTGLAFVTALLLERDFVLVLFFTIKVSERSMRGLPK